MKIILLVDVKNLGKKGSIVEVNDGMAQNMLFPQKKALPATQDNMNKHIARVADKTSHQSLITKKAEDFVKSLPESVIITAASNEAGTLFKAIHEKDIEKFVMDAVKSPMPSDVLITFSPIKTKGEFKLEFTVKNSKLKRVIVLIVN